MASVNPQKKLRGTASANAAVTLEEGTFVYLTDTKQIAVHDGSTAGGVIFGVLPDQVSTAEKTAGTETAVRGFSPDDVKDMIEINAPSYLVRAWARFDSDGTFSISASGNVSSITDNGTGDYTINFTTAFEDANYAILGTADNATGTKSPLMIGPGTSYPPTTSSCRVFAKNDAGNSRDAAFASVVFLR